MPSPLTDLTSPPSSALLVGPPLYVVGADGARYRVLDVARWGHVIHGARQLVLVDRSQPSPRQAR
jgi:hypothetical protein